MTGALFLAFNSASADTRQTVFESDDCNRISDPSKLLNSLSDAFLDHNKQIIEEGPSNGFQTGTSIFVFEIDTMVCVEEILKNEDRIKLFKLEPFQQVIAHHLLLLLKKGLKIHENESNGFKIHAL